MGWYICLKNENDDLCEVEPFDAGSEVIPDDYTTKSQITVTYNYRELFNFSWLRGKKAEETIFILKQRIEEFAEEEPSEDYWECTKGNVKKILKILLSWAEDYPEATWFAQ